MELITTNDAAKYLRLSAAILHNYRSKGYGGPTYIKLGGRYFYKQSDLDAWIDANTHTQPQAAPAKPQASRTTRAIKALTGRRGAR